MCYSTKWLNVLVWKKWLISLKNEGTQMYNYIWRWNKKLLKTQYHCWNFSVTPTAPHASKQTQINIKIKIFGGVCNQSTTYTNHHAYLNKYGFTYRKIQLVSHMDKHQNKNIYTWSSCHEKYFSLVWSGKHGFLTVTYCYLFFSSLLICFCLVLLNRRLVKCCSTKPKT